MGMRSLSSGRSVLRTSLLGALIGLGGAVGTTTLVRAADDAGLFEFLFGTAPRAAAPRLFEVRPAPPRAARASQAPPRRRWASRPAPRAVQTMRPRLAAAGRAAPPAPHERGGSRSVCVRTCDGYMFPLATLRTRADAPAHEAACAAACPGAETRLYTVDPGQELDRAVGLDGRPYRDGASAFLYRSRVVAGCSCRPDGALVAAPLPLDRDPTLRAGDAVATRSGGQVFTGRSGTVRPRFVEFRRAEILPAAWRRDLDRALDVSRREREQASFRAELGRAQRAELRPVRVAQMASFAVLATDAGFAPVRVVVPSPFR
ncbi:conserved hypothetical protein [Methylobacterium sp. 4-46]|uniref:DUF2865 domain-containing protein n=1 Tax=unclassified Methylobacterium TaxID=2615210 RepID=UPI000152D0C3|nr:MULTISPECIES: DUF2865 domain-containing protein [Methylobacterium]ACA17168.1 conserved hypothetical protein [Methylobacterium sp. 4-46]WFT82852.1 DUF2865 domain-containing protein [Methylobacterium nodulans]